MGPRLLSKGFVRRRFLVIGADGLLGGSLHHAWRAAGHDVFGTALSPLANREGIVRLDLSQEADLWPTLPRCEVAVLCAAITNLDECRRRPDPTRFVNSLQTALLARHLAGQGTFVIFMSSNLVFDGSRPFRPAAESPSPRTEYGRQKAEAEAALASLGSQCAIVRLTKVFHPGLPLIKNWSQQLSTGQVIRAFGDYVCSPIALDSVIQAVSRVAETRGHGVFQLSGTEDISYADIALHLARRLGCEERLVHRANGNAGGELEHLPACSTLDASRAVQELGFRWDAPLRVIDGILPP